MIDKGSRVIPGSESRRQSWKARASDGLRKSGLSPGWLGYRLELDAADPIDGTIHGGHVNHYQRGCLCAGHVL